MPHLIYAVVVITMPIVCVVEIIVIIFNLPFPNYAILFVPFWLNLENVVQVIWFTQL